MTETCSKCGADMDLKMVDGTTTDGTSTYECPQCGHQLEQIPPTIAGGTSMEKSPQDKYAELQQAAEHAQILLKIVGKIQEATFSLESEINTSVYDGKTKLTYLDLSDLELILNKLKKMVVKCQSQP